MLETVRRAHVIGAGGIGVSAVAKLLKHAGASVTGSDVARNESVAELEQMGIPIAIGHAAANVPADADLIVYSGAVPVGNPEREEGRRRGIRELSYFQFLGEFSKEKRTIAVSGTNGKSTTTALLGLMLERAGLDPTVIVGSKVGSFSDKNLRVGGGDIFVVEGCEHEANFLYLHPRMIVLTNVEEDHLDYYRDLDHIRGAFQEYIERLPSDGRLIVNADDHVSFSELKPKTAFTTYAAAYRADFVVRDVRAENGAQTFEMLRRGESLGEFVLHVPGKFNVMNALAAATAALELGASADAVRTTLRDFAGIWRRFERVGERDGAPIISDYGHHPTAIRGTLEGTREFFPGRRVVLAFQPHQHNRTRKLFDEFVASFDGADVLVLAEIFDVAGREQTEDQKVSSNDLVDAVRKRDAERKISRRVEYAPSMDATRALLQKLIEPNDVVLVMGAGDIYRIASSLAEPGTHGVPGTARASL